MKTMLAMALVFGFSALGCGVPVEGDEQTVDEPGVLESALTTSGFCELSGKTMNGQCSAPLVGTTCPARAASPTCVSGTVSTRVYSTCATRSRAGLALSPVPCTF